MQTFRNVYSVVMMSTLGYGHCLPPTLTEQSTLGWLQRDRDRSTIVWIKGGNKRKIRAEQKRNLRRIMFFFSNQPSYKGCKRGWEVVMYLERAF